MTEGPTDQLRREHELVLMVVEAMEREVADIERTGHVHSERVAQMIDFTRNFTDGNHHTKEEELLFPLLEERSVSAGGTVSILLSEHEAARDCIRKIDAALPDAERERGGTRRHRREPQAVRLSAPPPHRQGRHGALPAHRTPSECPGAGDARRRVHARRGGRRGDRPQRALPRPGAHAGGAADRRLRRYVGGCAPATLPTSRTLQRSSTSGQLRAPAGRPRWRAGKTTACSVGKPPCSVRRPRSYYSEPPSKSRSAADLERIEPRLAGGVGKRAASRRVRTAYSARAPVLFALFVGQRCGSVVQRVRTVRTAARRCCS